LNTDVALTSVDPVQNCERFEYLMVVVLWMQVFWDVPLEVFPFLSYSWQLQDSSVDNGYQRVEGGVEYGSRSV
jgi:hypothetical protein